MTLKTARRRAKLTQAELAKRSRVDQSTISRLERGQRPEGDTLVALAKALKVDAAELQF